MTTPTLTTPTSFRARLDQARAELARNHIDWLFVGPGDDLRYLTGTGGHLSERMSGLLLPATGDAAFIVGFLEAPTVAQLGAFATIRTWEETEDPAALAAELIGGGSPKIAVGDTLWSMFLIRLQQALPAARWREGGPVLRPLRMIKDASEIATMREAAERTDAGWAAFIQTSIAGLTEREALQRLLDLTHAQGLEPGFGICASGPNSASPHHGTSDRVIQPGDSVVFDWGGEIDGYKSDVTRTVFVGGAGEPDAEYRRAYAAVLAANEAALAAVKPGVACEAIDAAARSVITDAGLGEYFIHRVGHGLGLSIHEEPYLVAGNTLPLAVGMVFSDEPGVYLPGKFGIRIEDTVICTETGGEQINHAPRDLIVMG